MRLRLFAFLSLALLWIACVETPTQVQAETTMSCPAGQYDMLDWMTLDSDLRDSQHFSGSANPLYTTMLPDKFYWTKSSSGYPWDIQLIDDKFIYLWITEYAWGDPNTYKKFSANTNMPLAPRCAKAGFPGSTIKVSNTSYDIYTDCNNHTTHDLKNAINQVWGPYATSLGGDLPKNLPTLVVTYRYDCDATYGNCANREAYYLTQRYGLVQWVYYKLIDGKYQQQNKSVFNSLTPGTVDPDFTCF